MNIVKPEEVGLSTERLIHLTNKMQYFIDAREIAGTVSLIARRGQVAHFQAQGLQDAEANIPMQLDTLFRIYSMTKPITSLAVMMLYEVGHFQLNEPIKKYIPVLDDLKVFVKQGFTGFELAELERDITIHDLLIHTAGFSYGFFADSPIEAMYREPNILRPENSLAEMMAELAEKPLYYQPGTNWRYSVATDILGHLVEVVSGQPFDTFLQERILNPLGMQDTSFVVSEEKMHRLAAYYEPDETGCIRLRPPEVSRNYVQSLPNKSGGGGLVSTAADYLRFTQMMLNGGQLDGLRLVSRKTIELMTSNHIKPELMPLSIGGNELGGYGFGLGVRVMLDPAQAETLGSIGEYGWAGIATTYFFIDPQEEMIGISMAQLLPPETHPIRYFFHQLAYQAIID